MRLNLMMLAAMVCCSSCAMVTTSRAVWAHSIQGSATRSVVIMKKGRKQGGGPKITTRKVKRKTEAELATEKRKRDLTRLAVTRKKKPTLGIARQHERFTAQVSDGSPRFPVFVR